MNSLVLLFGILVVLLLLVTGRQGLRNLLGLLLNLGLLFFLMTLISWKVNAVLAGAVLGVLMLAIAIFMSSDDTKTTAIAFKASLLVLAGVLILALVVQHLGQFQGFAGEDNESLEELSLAVGLNFGDVAIVVMLISALGAVAEAAMAVTADLMELVRQSSLEDGLSNLTETAGGEKSDLTGLSKAAESEKIGLTAVSEVVAGEKKGLSNLTAEDLAHHRRIVSRQIAGTALNTLFFTMLGTSVALILWMVRLGYTPAALLNSKLLMMDVVTMLIGMLGILLVIWLSGHYVIMEFENSQDD
ncbi:MAG: YibE/F family protein [Streptococcaceae bacterium]|jgi:uncharacterized membrane protein|nr:YibE/F family protein [Streptococcaceae bacterium]